MTYPYQRVPSSGDITVNDDNTATLTYNNETYKFADLNTATAYLTLIDNKSEAAMTWASGVSKMIRDLETLLAEANKLKIIYDDNDLFDLVVATPDGSIVPGMSMTKLRSIIIGSLMQDLDVFLSQDTVGNPPNGIPMPIRRKVITQRMK
jgi:hypothetical protein